VLSLQLPFAIWPLVRMTSDRQLMGPFASGPAMRIGAWLIFTLVAAANAWLLVSLAR